MAYQTGTATGISDLLDKLDTFVAANGWTVNRRDATSLSISKGNIYQNYGDLTTEINMAPSTGYNAGNAWNQQPGYSTLYTQKSKQMSGAFSAYHFFVTDDYVHVVVEVDPGLFRHLATGEIEKTSAYTGGQYSGAVQFLDNGNYASSLFKNTFSNTSPTEFGMVSTLYAPVSGVSDWRHFHLNLDSLSRKRVYSTDFKAELNNDKFSLFGDWYKYGTPWTLNGISPLIPIYFFIERDSGYMSPLGYVKDLRLVNMASFSPNDIYTLGTNNWIIFPASIKSPAGTYATDNYGYAYKIVP